jgi:hypothetical protein
MKQRFLACLSTLKWVGRCYTLMGIPVMVATLDLGQEWQKIDDELHKLLDECAVAASPVNIANSAPVQCMN